MAQPLFLLCAPALVGDRFAGQIDHRIEVIQRLPVVQRLPIARLVAQRPGSPFVSRQHRNVVKAPAAAVRLLPINPVAPVIRIRMVDLPELVPAVAHGHGDRIGVAQGQKFIYLHFSIGHPGVFFYDIEHILR